MKDVSRLHRAALDTGRLERRAETPPPCGMRCPHSQIKPAETTKHRKCMRSAAGCAHTLFKN